MTERDDLTAKQKDYAVFLPAISGFYATFIGKQRDPANGPYVDPARFPPGMTDMEQLNWLNAKKLIVTVFTPADTPILIWPSRTGLKTWSGIALTQILIL